MMKYQTQGSSFTTAIFIIFVNMSLSETLWPDQPIRVNTLQCQSHPLDENCLFIYCWTRQRGASVRQDSTHRNPDFLKQRKTRAHGRDFIPHLTKKHCFHRITATISEAFSGVTATSLTSHLTTCDPPEPEQLQGGPRVLANMCHVKFALTGKEGGGRGRADRNAEGLMPSSGKPFLRGISCLVKR